MIVKLKNFFCRLLNMTFLENFKNFVTCRYFVITVILMIIYIVYLKYPDSQHGGSNDILKYNTKALNRGIPLDQPYLLDDPIATMYNTNYKFYDVQPLEQSSLVETASKIKQESTKLTGLSGGYKSHESFMDDQLAKAYSANDKFYHRDPAEQVVLMEQQQSITDQIPQLNIFQRINDDKVILQQREVIPVLNQDLPGNKANNSGYIYESFENLQEINSDNVSTEQMNNTDLGTNASLDDSSVSNGELINFGKFSARIIAKKSEKLIKLDMPVHLIYNGKAGDRQVQVNQIDTFKFVFSEISNDDVLRINVRVVIQAVKPIESEIQDESESSDETMYLNYKKGTFHLSNQAQFFKLTK